MGDDATHIQQLLARAKAGDMAAFEALFEPQRRLLHALAYRLVGNRACDDVVPETCLRAWQALPEFEGHAGWAGWLCRIARNCALDELRRRQRQHDDDHISKDDETHGEAIEALPDTQMESPEQQAQRQDLGGALQRALQELSEDHRVALTLREVDDMSYQDIATVTGVSIGTVMSRLFNARRRLRRIMEEKYHEYL